MTRAYYTAANAAVALGVTPPRVWQMILAGEMAASTSGIF